MKLYKEFYKKKDYKNDYNVLKNILYKNDYSVVKNILLEQSMYNLSRTLSEDCPLKIQLDKQKAMWEILKTFIKNRPYCAGYEITKNGIRLIEDILEKMQELEAEDVKD